MRWREYRKKGVLMAVFFTLALVFAVVVTYLSGDMIPGQRYGMYKVTRVDSAGNIVINKGGQQQRVFLIGINDGEHNSPEWERARKFVKEQIHEELVSVEYDKVRTKESTLNIVDYCYVYTKDGRMLNAVLIAEGFTDYEPDDVNDEYDMQFTYLKEKSKKEKLGIWKDSKGDSE